MKTLDYIAHLAGGMLGGWTLLLLPMYSEQ